MYNILCYMSQCFADNKKVEFILLAWQSAD